MGEHQNNNLERTLQDYLSQESGRLVRVEEKLDKLTDTVVALARAEEKLVSLEIAKAQVVETQEEHEDRIVALEKRVGAVEMPASVLTKVFWLAAAAGSTYIVSLLVGGQI